MNVLFLFLYSFILSTRKDIYELWYFLVVFLALLLYFRPKKSIFKSLLALSGIELGIFAMAIFNPGKPILSTPFGEITEEGIQMFVLLFSKAFLSSATILTVTSAVGISTILNELKELKVPSIILLTLALAYAYLELFSQEIKRMKRALDSRAFGLSKVEYYKTLGLMIGELVRRVYIRGIKVSWAMQARNFSEFPTFSGNKKVHPLFIILTLGGFFL
ncbi:cobalt ABC transporter permease [Pyrococcus furiosus DSM 3638]|uniref:Cobalt ABC transporter permease n=3 Tax=Pyrococcus furiosus TaxID=2261 RepID=Q8U3D9_PYRFU|nr:MULTISPECIES: energy-coupling factor transporter transmembrane component T [Pyrococcus]AAL80653.1 hypothetical protein PF0529 [Pyrococcus furiosus DSM 3638]AFN03324.1 cobalt ABC transporter permease CbiQ [Pyrococcus furiosus COM1]MDK2870160.1 cobalt/nickel transport system permease protein [Pyrococcus sp.]QEK78241.1 cobalt ABC transporter permease [Pyrococcus furiosus DSM 3638]